mgnify:CR=1 FL=1
MMHFTAAGQARGAVPGRDPAIAPAGSNARASFTRWLLALCCVAAATAVGGCAQNPAQQEVRTVTQPAPARISPRPAPAPKVAASLRRPDPVREPALRIRKPDPSLLALQPAPDCEFRRADVKAVDPEAWARLKIEYERQCYLEAEKTARERLSLLQAASTCEIEPAAPQKPAR